VFNGSDSVIQCHLTPKLVLIHASINSMVCNGFLVVFFLLKFVSRHETTVFMICKKHLPTLDHDYALKLTTHVIKRFAIISFG
jgi:hypothetical protein